MWISFCLNWVVSLTVQSKVLIGIKYTCVDVNLGESDTESASKMVSNPKEIPTAGIISSLPRKAPMSYISLNY